MPVLGNSRDRVRTFGDFPMIPDRYQAAMRWGIRFFELRLREKADNDKPLFGPYDVRVQEYFNSAQRKNSFHDIWLTDRDAHIRYEVDSRGTGVAFMPDDKYWHNRILIMDNPALLVMQYHTKDGILPGTIIYSEIECLRKVLKHEIPIWKVLEGNIERDYFHSKEEAEGFIDERSKIIEKVDATGNIKRSLPKKKNYRIVEGTKLVYRPEIQKLIKNEKAHRFGWTECLYFQEKIKPKVESLIQKKNEEMSTSTDETAKRNSLLKEMLNLSPKEKEKLKQFLLSDSSSSKIEDEPRIPVAPLPEGVSPEYVWEERSNPTLKRMTLPELKLIVEGRGFTVDGLNKEDLIYKILESDKGAKKPKTQEIVA